MMFNQLFWFKRAYEANAIVRDLLIAAYDEEERIDCEGPYSGLASHYLKRIQLYIDSRMQTYGGFKPYNPDTGQTLASESLHPYFLGKKESK